MKSAAIGIILIFSTGAVYAADEKVRPPHLLPVTDEDLKTLDAVVADFPKLCVASDEDCIASVRLRELARRWNAALAQTK